MYMGLKKKKRRLSATESWFTEKGSAYTGEGESSHLSSVNFELNPEPLIFWSQRLRWSLLVKPRR